MFYFFGFCGSLLLLLHVFCNSTVKAIMTQCHILLLLLVRHPIWWAFHQFKWGAATSTHCPHWGFYVIFMLATASNVCFDSFEKHATKKKTKKIMNTGQSFVNGKKLKWLNLLDSLVVSQWISEWKAKIMKNWIATSRIPKLKTIVFFDQPNVDGYFYLLDLSRSKRNKKCGNIHTHTEKKRRLEKHK